MHKRKFLKAMAIPAAGLFPTMASWAAEPWPQRPIKVLVPFQPGNTADIWARSLGTALAARLGQPFVVENMPGAGGSIGANALKRAAADGYTLGVFANTQAITAHTFTKPPYVLTTDFLAIAPLGSNASVLTVPADSPYRTAQELIAALKAKPGALSYGSGGNGSIAHLGMAQLLRATGTKALHVPYKGSLDIVSAQLSGQTQFGMPVLGSAVAFIKDGRLRALAVTGGKRSPLVPDVPTLMEALPPGFQLDSWAGVFAPAGTPTSIVERLHKEITAILKSGAMDELAKAMGSDVNTTASAADFQRFVTAENKRYGELVEAVGVKVDGR
jgi:tripartite-type tricarboxylate transporter receptor subunit TctC